MPSYSEGARGALLQLGIAKEAGDTPLYESPEGYKPFWQSVGATAKRQLIGNPAQAWQELRSGDWKNPGSYVRRSFWNAPPSAPGAGTLDKVLGGVGPALNYLPGVLGLYGASQAPSDQKGEAYGNAGGSMLGMALGMPFGLVGTTVGSLAGSHIGGALGKMFDHRKPVPAYHGASYEPQQQ